MYCLLPGLPVVLVVGLTTNPIIFCLMRRRSIAVSRRTRMYYLTIAVADFLILLSVHLGQGFLGDGLKWASGGAVYLYIPRINNIFCKVCI